MFQFGGLGVLFRGLSLQNPLRDEGTGLNIAQRSYGLSRIQTFFKRVERL